MVVIMVCKSHTRERMAEIIVEMLFFCGGLTFYILFVFDCIGLGFES